MILIGILLVSLIIHSGFCWNTTDKFMKMEERDFRSKQGRLLTFNTDDGDIEVGVELVVPFIKIPIKNSLDATKGTLANINLGSLLLAGIITFCVAVVIPAILALFNKNMFLPDSPQSTFFTGSSNSYRGSDSSDAWRYLTVLDNILLENNIDTTTCTQRAICWSVRNSARNVSTGHGTSTDKILNGLATSEWLQSYFVNTPFDTAVKDGLNDRNCSKEYEKCKITQRTMNTLAKKFAKMINGDWK